MSSMTLTEFLLARIAEDEAAAQVCAEMFPSPWEVSDRGWRVRIYSANVPDVGDHAEPDWERAPAVMEVEPDRNLDDPLWLSDRVEHVRRHDPSRVQSDCEAKRRIIERASRSTVTVTSKQPSPFGNLSMAEGRYFAEDGRDVTEAFAAWHLVDGQPADPWTLKTLALVYADHPDYREEWRP